MIKAFTRMPISDRVKHLMARHPEIADEPYWTEQNHYWDHMEWEQDHDHERPFPIEDSEDEQSVAKA
jgi:hypothetical protein